PIFVVVAAPQHVEHVAECRLADFAAGAVAVDLEHLLHRSQPLTAQNLAQLLLGERHARTENAPGFLFELRRDGPQQVLAELAATAAARPRARRLLQLRHRADALLVDGLDDRALRHTDAATDGRRVRHVS